MSAKVVLVVSRTEFAARLWQKLEVAHSHLDKKTLDQLSATLLAAFERHGFPFGTTVTEKELMALLYTMPTTSRFSASDAEKYLKLLTE